MTPTMKPPISVSAGQNSGMLSRGFLLVSHGVSFTERHEFAFQRGVCHTLGSLITRQPLYMGLKVTDSE